MFPAPHLPNKYIYERLLMATVALAITVKMARGWGKLADDRFNLLCHSIAGIIPAGTDPRMVIQ